MSLIINEWGKLKITFNIFKIQLSKLKKTIKL